MVALIYGGGEALPDDRFELALGIEELVALVGSAGILVAGVDLEEGLDEAGGGVEVLGVERLLDAVEATGAFDDGVDAGEGGVDAGLGEVELADLAGDLVGEIAGGSDGGEHVVGVGADDLEDVCGFLEGEELLVEIGALGEEGFEVEIEAALVGDALVEEAGHGAHVR